MSHPCQQFSLCRSFRVSFEALWTSWSGNSLRTLRAGRTLRSHFTSRSLRTPIAYRSLDTLWTLLARVTAETDRALRPDFTPRSSWTFSAVGAIFASRTLRTDITLLTLWTKLPSFSYFALRTTFTLWSRREADLFKLLKHVQRQTQRDDVQKEREPNHGRDCTIFLLD